MEAKVAAMANILSLEGALLRGRPLTARRAAVAIAIITVLVTAISAILIRFVDSKDFDSAGSGFWWAVQTVTTVGYGDAVPTTAAGKFIAALVMVTGIGFVTVVTAAVTAAFVESARRRLGQPSDPHAIERLDDVVARLDRLETLLRERPSN
jgi:voltage-gated potassium channel